MPQHYGTGDAVPFRTLYYLSSVVTLVLPSPSLCFRSSASSVSQKAEFQNQQSSSQKQVNAMTADNTIGFHSTINSSTRTEIMAVPWQCPWHSCIPSFLSCKLWFSSVFAGSRPRTVDDGRGLINRTSALWTSIHWLVLNKDIRSTIKKREVNKPLDTINRSDGSWPG